MTSLRRAVARTGLVGGAVLLAAATTVPLAGAESADLEYSCDFGIEMGEGQGTEGSGETTARFDSGIGSALVVPTGTAVSLDPFTGTVALPDEFVQQVRDAEITEIEGGGVTFMVVDESGEDVVIEMAFPATEVPETGPLSLTLTGEDVPSVTAVEGANTLLAGDLIVGFDAEDYSAGMYCELTDEGDVAVDAFVGDGASPSPTATAEPTATPQRPVVVQTDFAADEGAPGFPLLAGAGVVLAAAGTLTGVRRARRAARRRH